MADQIAACLGPNSASCARYDYLLQSILPAHQSSKVSQQDIDVNERFENRAFPFGRKRRPSGFVHARRSSRRTMACLCTSELPQHIPVCIHFVEYPALASVQLTIVRPFRPSSVDIPQPTTPSRQPQVNLDPYYRDAPADTVPRIRLWLQVSALSHTHALGRASQLERSHLTHNHPLPSLLTSCRTVRANKFGHRGPQAYIAGDGISTGQRRRPHIR